MYSNIACKQMCCNFPYVYVLTDVFFIRRCYHPLRIVQGRCRNLGVASAPRMIHRLKIYNIICNDISIH